LHRHIPTIDVSCCTLISSLKDCWLIRCDVGQVATIDVLPDDVLLTIFDCYVVGYQDLRVALADQNTRRKMERWQSLVHVCRRWRGLVFGSPRRLNLQLCCTTRTPARATLDVWPALPLLILGDVDETSVDNVIAELEYSDRICQINLFFHATSPIEKLRTAMQVPFPELAVLRMYLVDMSYVPVLPDSILGGSAPRLRFLALASIPFPGLPNLLLSATHLVNLYLYNIPDSGYFSPESMATCLSMLTSLEELDFQFNSPQSSPDQESRPPPPPPPPTRSVLPALTIFVFKGVNEYLEELVARIDAPRLYQLSIIFFNDIDFDTPELVQFISRALPFEAPKDVHVVFADTAWITLQRQASRPLSVKVEILCRLPNWQLSSLAQICTLSLPLLSTMENLYIHEHLRSNLFDGKDGIENTEWLELLLPFTDVKNLYLSQQFARRIAPALQELTGGRTAEVLPTLQHLFLDEFRPSEPLQEGIRQLISARQLTNHPIAVSLWERD
jgi:hypothetical protein